MVRESQEGGVNFIIIMTRDARHGGLCIGLDMYALGGRLYLYAIHSIMLLTLIFVTINIGHCRLGFGSLQGQGGLVKRG